MAPYPQPQKEGNRQAGDDKDQDDCQPPEMAPRVLRALAEGLVVETGHFRFHQGAAQDLQMGGVPKED